MMYTSSLLRGGKSRCGEAAASAVSYGVARGFPGPALPSSISTRPRSPGAAGAFASTSGASLRSYTSAARSESANM